MNRHIGILVHASDCLTYRLMMSRVTENRRKSSSSEPDSLTCPVKVLLYKVIAAEP